MNLESAHYTQQIGRYIEGAPTYNTAILRCVIVRSYAVG
jgi:hypothetical protein